MKIIQQVHKSQRVECDESDEALIAITSCVVPGGVKISEAAAVVLIYVIMFVIPATFSYFNCVAQNICVRDVAK